MHVLSVNLKAQSSVTPLLYGSDRFSIKSGTLITLSLHFLVVLNINTLDLLSETTAFSTFTLESPRHEAERVHFLDVQVVAIEEVSVGGAAEVDA